jgi:hypothetical protein
MIDPKVKITVSRHAVQRLRERFYFRFKGYFGNFQMTENLIKAQVSNGVVMNDWKECPFYANKMGSMYGKGFQIIKKSGVYFLCSMNDSDNALIVKTCVPRIMYYK